MKKIISFLQILQIFYILKSLVLSLILFIIIILKLTIILISYKTNHFFKFFDLIKDKNNHIKNNNFYDNVKIKKEDKLKLKLN